MFFTNDILEKPQPEGCLDNCAVDMIERGGGRIFKVRGTLNADNTSAVVNLFKIHGTVEIINAYAEVMEVTTLTNCTGCYFDLYDGTVAIEITDNAGAVLSGAPVGSMILRTGIASQIATVVLSDQCRITETDSSKKTHQPFSCTQKNGVDTFIRAHYTTTDAPINAVVDFYVVYSPFNGGYVEAATS